MDVKLYFHINKGLFSKRNLSPRDTVAQAQFLQVNEIVISITKF